MKNDWPAKLAQGTAYLKSADPTLARIITAHPLPSFRPHTNYYHELVESIVSQQLSIKAADTIFKRFLDLFGGSFPAPEAILAQDIERYRSVGLSRQKAAYIRDLAEKIITKSFLLKLETYLDSGNYDNAIAFCEKDKTVFSRIVELIIINRKKDKSYIESIVEQEAKKQLYSLSKSNEILGSLSNISTLLGLLGTISGMITVFRVISTQTVVDPPSLAGGISEVQRNPVFCPKNRQNWAISPEASNRPKKCSF